MGKKFPEIYDAQVFAPAPATTELVGIDGVTRIAGFFPISSPPTGIYVGFAMDRERALGPLVEAARLSLALISGGVFLALLVAFLVGRRYITRPMAVLARMAARWAAGDYGTIVDVPRGDSEIATLGRSFNTLVESVRHREAKLQDALSILSENEERLRLAAENAGLGWWDVDLVTGVRRWSRSHFETFGYPPTADGIADPMMWRDRVHPKDRERAVAEVEAARFDRQPYRSLHRIVRADTGDVVWLAARGAFVYDETTSKAVRFSGIFIDDTARQNAEQKLRELNDRLEERVAERTRALEGAMAEQQQTHEALRQAQKMEAVGRLTAGIAHDFNNLLMVVLGSLEIAAERTDDKIMRRLISAAATAAEKGAALTAQLLAFGRQHTMRIETTNLNAAVENVRELLQRSLGGTIAVRYELVADAWPASADPTQLEMAIMNLAINARDAMSSGGSLTIRTLNLPAGDPELHMELPPSDYVAISVEDTGVGMVEEVAAKAFDPFFTTKGVGKGSGLGLSTVWGMATQCGGTVRLKTSPGAGTTVTIFLPRSEPVADDNARELPRPVSTVRFCGRVLLADDVGDVRELLAEQLREEGCEVNTAANGREALNLLAERGADLLIADFAMPEMNGIELAQSAREMVPGLPVLLITGYADAATLAETGLAGSVLRKPFRREEFIVAVRAVLAPNRDVGRTDAAPLRAASAG